MRPAPAALVSFLNGANYQAVVIDLYTFALAGGETLRYSGGNATLTCAAPLFADPNSLNYGAARTFLLGPRFGRSKTSAKVGVEPAELDIDVLAGGVDTIGTLSFANAARLGLFDGATVELDRYFAAPDGAALGCLTWFYGRVADCGIGRSNVRIKVKSLMNLLAVQQMPRRLFQASCSHIFGDAMCGYNRTTGVAGDGTAGGPAQVTVTAAAGSTPDLLNLTGPLSTQYYEGTVTGLAGANAG